MQVNQVLGKLCKVDGVVAKYDYSS
jgi:hypothetical protein